MHRLPNFHPVDQSEPTQHQVVTATGESSFLYGSELHGGEIPIGIGGSDGLVPEFAEDESFPAKKACLDTRLSGKNIGNIIKPAKFKAPEIDVSSGIVCQTPDKEHVSLHSNKKKENVKVVAEKLGSNTTENLNIHLRQNAWVDAIINDGKTNKGGYQRGVRVESYVMPDNFKQFGLYEDNFDDFSHLNSRYYDEHMKGFVVMGTKKAVSGLLNATDLNIGTHGVIMDMSLPPSFDGLFEEGECDQFKFVRHLGNGSFGSVSLCRHFGGEEYVMKVIKDRFKKKEVEVLMQLSHPSITGFRGYILRDGIHEIMMEYGGDSLKVFMNEHKTAYKEFLTDDVVTSLAHQGFLGLEYMYERFGILHLDIKPENVCIKLDPVTLKLTDFGTSKTPQQLVTFDGWTPEYMSPEACLLLLTSKMPNIPMDFHPKLSGKADVYSFALTICFMLTGNHTVAALWPPGFNMDKLGEWRGQYIHHLAQNPSFIQKLAIKDDWPKEMRDLLTAALEGNPGKRCSARQACTYLKNQSIPQPVNIQSMSYPGSLIDNLPTSDSLYEQPPSPPDVSLSQSHGGGGKDIKNQLRRKIRLKSVNPYQRQPSEVALPKPDVEKTSDGLPVFDILL
ncbi:serine/threonine-protein kinase 10-like [Haliotis cracherodii]|uniref:serine/threonine-protein kinase 10-like n=1 Tax=Haliotis cracherodii TaxID=6455 RepID=UPI0039EC41FF